MRFGPVPLRDAVGGIVAHAVRRDGLVLKKGDLVTFEHLNALEAAGVTELVVAQLEAGDIGEDEAAALLAQSIVGAHVRVDPAFTGRANLFATASGILSFDAAAVNRLNEVDETITLATLPAFRAVVEGEMIATVKIIPFAVAGERLRAAQQAAQGLKLSVAPYQPLRIGVISTLLPGLKPTTITKTLRVLEERLAPSGARITQDKSIDHNEAALTAAIKQVQRDSDLVIVFGASAITDRRDVIPSAVEAAGGKIIHFGMPVDPGNLLLIGALLGHVPVLGAPGCARSPKENGFDWILQRLLAGMEVTAQDIKRMGVGGLLMEIISRGQPRSGEAPHGDE